MVSLKLGLEENNLLVNLSFFWTSVSTETEVKYKWENNWKLSAKARRPP